jgi:tRNA A-37 threonylcarbamoyl transferase component Bud32
MYTKHFTGTPPEDILREFRLQQISAGAGYSPLVVDTDGETFIRMEHLMAPCLAEKYGRKVQDLPDWIRAEIVEILWDLYNTYGIHYVDVTPFNFIEKKGRVWIIDFGHATMSPDMDAYLERLFNQWELTEWNPEFQ